jgi:hypothetical protein
VLGARPSPRGKAKGRLGLHEACRWLSGTMCSIMFDRPGYLAHPQDFGSGQRISLRSEMNPPRKQVLSPPNDEQRADRILLVTEKGRNDSLLRARRRQQDNAAQAYNFARGMSGRPSTQAPPTKTPRTSQTSWLLTKRTRAGGRPASATSM